MDKCPVCGNNLDNAFVAYGSAPRDELEVCLNCGTMQATENTVKRLRKEKNLNEIRVEINETDDVKTLTKKIMKEIENKLNMSDYIDY
ncbi:MAG: hypothetical protein ACLFPS_07900 [Clostridia bacterium]